jgi:hypothetical protein
MKEDVATDHSNYIFLQSISIIIEMRMVKLRNVSYRPPCWSACRFDIYCERLRSQ